MGILMIMKVLLVCDVNNWAWHYKALGIKKNLPNHRIDIVYTVAEPRFEPKMLPRYDHIHFFGWYMINLTTMKPHLHKISTSVASIEYVLPHRKHASDEVLKKVTVVSVSEILHDLLKKKYKSVYPCFNGVDEAKFQPKEGYVRGDVLRVGACCKPPSKYDLHGYELLFKIKTALEEYPDILCDFHIANHKTGKSHDFMKKYYHNIDVFLHTGKYHLATPNPAFEAGSSGVPVVCTANGCLPLLIKDGINGYIFDMDLTDDKKVALFVEKILYLRDNKDHHMNMREAMRNEILNHWTWAQRALDWEPVFLSTNRVLYLCNKKYYDTKMSRGRFHYIEALQRHMSVDIWGVGWDKYDNTGQVVNNLRRRGKPYSHIICYQPREYNGLSRVKDQMKILVFNEMYKKDSVVFDFKTTKPDVVVCHHLNEMNNYVGSYPKIQFVNIPHCSDIRFFRDYGLPKIYDIAVIGRQSLKHYPLRHRMKRLLQRYKGIPGSRLSKYNIYIHPHPGYNLKNASNNQQVIQYAKMLNQSKICIFCSGVPKTRFAKYVEVPLCGSVVCADKPDDTVGPLIEINMSMSDTEIIDTLVSYLKNPEKLEKIRKEGLEYAEKYTTEYYTREFLKLF